VGSDFCSCHPVTSQFTVFTGSEAPHFSRLPCFIIEFVNKEQAMSDNLGEKLARKSRPSSQQVRLTLRFISVWSAAKISFLCGVGLGLVGGIALFVLWAVLDRLGVFTQLNSVLSGTTAGSGSVTSAIGFTQALGISFLVGILTTISATVVGTIAAALYNLGVRITGGATVGFSTQSRER